jgi:2-dehydropantoate 2-reductase
MKVALMGVGSLGTIIGALISKKEENMVLIDSNTENVDVLNRKGATVTGNMKLQNVPVKAITPDQMDGIYDIVFYSVKQTHNNVALNQLLPHLGSDSVVCTLQNGVPENAVAEIVGPERTTGGAVGWGATWIGPGISMLTSEPDKMTYDIGELDGTISPRILEIKKILNLSGKAKVVNNLAGIRWTKLLINATFSGMSAVLGCYYGDIMDDEKALSCVAHIANETINVINAMDIIMEPIQGHDLRILAFNNKQEMMEKMPIYKHVWKPHRMLKASMLQDLEKGKKCEIEAINGVISTWGKRVNVPTPINDKVVEIIRGIETEQYIYDFANLKMFKLPEVPWK